MKYCTHCGQELVDDAVVCTNCGREAPKNIVSNVEGGSEKSRLVALLLVLFVGGFGIHRFYVGKIGTGVLWLLTAGLFGIGVLVDLILIVTGSFTDKEGNKLTNWDM
ncbi:MAG: TM2 domain-containing protein [Bacilli bacterium]|jgi:TM2 domain-containing membrane protein YozV|nr:TM2 domain-containing protein [Bacilli bacterium]